MANKAKSKRKATIIVSVLMALIVLCGIGMGIFYFVKDRNGEGLLSSRQVAFGNSINSFNGQPLFSKVDYVRGEEGGSLADTLMYSSEYTIVQNASLIKAVNNQSGAVKQLSYNAGEVKAIYGKVLAVKQGEQLIFVDLDTLNILASSVNATVTYAMPYLLVKANGDGEVLAGDKAQSVIINTMDATVVKRIVASDNVLNVSLANGYYIVEALGSTEVFDVKDEFKKILSFDNRGTKNEDVYNLASQISASKYFMECVYHVSAMADDVLFIEKVTLDNDNAVLISKLSNGEDVSYNLEYTVHHVKSDTDFVMDARSGLFAPMSVDFSSEYFAVIETKLDANKRLTENQTITYYQIDSTLTRGKMKANLHKLVSYNYDYGVVVGFEKSRLLTSGGKQPAVINFNGERQNVVNEKAGERISSVNFNSGMLVVSSVTGLKGLNSSDGNVLFAPKYERISPVWSGKVVAKLNGEYYLLGEDKKPKLIEHFAKEFEDVVFAGIGYYITKQSDGVYSVFDLNGVVFKENTSLSFIYDGTFVSMKVGEEIVRIKPLTAVSPSQTGIQSVSVDLDRGLNSFAYAVANAVRVTGDPFAISEVNTDSVTGAGYAKFAASFASNQITQRIKPYSELTTEQKALIPAFDDAENLSYLTTIGSNTYTYKFAGAMVFVHENVALTVVKLTREDNAQNYYLANIALKNSYLKQAKFESTAAGIVSPFGYADADGVYFKEFNSPYTMAGALLSGGFAFEEESAANTSRSVNYAAAGYDSGMTFVSKSAETFNFEFTISNIFIAKNLETEYYNFDEIVDQTVIDAPFYTLTVNKTETKKSVTISAKEGYVIVRANIGAGVKDQMSDTFTYNEVAALDGSYLSYEADFTDKEGNYFKLQNLDIVEKYGYLNLTDIEPKENEDKTYYFFYGYGSGLSLPRNPQPFAFKDFKRVSSSVTYERTGYNFDGFTISQDPSKLVIDKDGNFVGDAEWFKFETLPANFDLVAKYVAKTYKIYYKASDEGGYLEQTTDATYDSEIGTLLDGSSLPASGYRFVGWYFMGKPVNEQTIYTFDNPITLVARFEPKEYTLNLHSNLDTYKNVAINGYEYNIDKLVLLSNFDGYLTDEDVPSVMTKHITYDSTYGNLPGFEGLELVEDQVKVVYKFIGWFTNSNFIVNGNTISRGDKIETTTKVENDPPVLDLYAHFEREVYGVTFSESGDTGVTIDGKVLDRVKEFEYSGASENGVKGQFSTLEKDGYGLLNKDNKNKYNLYSVSNAPLALNIHLNTGYFISKLTIDVYGENARKIEYVNKLDDNYTLEGNDSDVTISGNRSDIEINLTNIASGKDDPIGKLYANITAEILAIKYKNSFTLDGGVTVKRGDFSLSSTGEDSAIIYNKTNVYELKTKQATGYDNKLVNLNFIKSIDVNGVVINFDYAYKKVDGVYKSVYETEYELSSSEVSGAKTIYKYAVSNATVILEVDGNLNTILKIEITSLKDNEISIISEDISSTVKFNVNNTSTAANKANGAELNVTKHLQSGENTEQILSEFNHAGLNANEWLVFNVKLQAGFVFDTVTGLTINYAGNVFNFLGFNNTISDSGISQSQKAVYTTDVGRLVEGKYLLNGTGFAVSFDKTSNTLTVIVKDIREDIEINVNYYKYTMLKVTGDSGSFVLKPFEGSYAGKTFEEMMALKPSEFTQDGGYYIVYKNEDTANTLKLETTKQDKLLYTINSSSSITSDGITLSENNTVSVINRNKTYVASFEVTKISSLIRVNSFLSRADDVYEKEPISGLDVQAYFYIDFYNAAGDRVSSSKSTFSYTSFYGTYLRVRVYKIDGYSIDSAYLSLKGSSDKILPINTDFNELKENAYYEYVYEVYSTFTANEYEFNLYEKAAKYKVKFDTANDSDNPTIGTIDDVTCYYNVWFNLPDVTLTRVGYTHIGWSKIRVLGTDLSEADVDFTVGGRVEENLTTENGGEVTLYAVFKANTYSLVYQPNDATKGNGSSVAKLGENGAVLVKFNHEIGELKGISRQGYKFTGWVFETDADDIAISSSMILDKELFEKIKQKDDNSVTVKALWQVITYSVNVVANDKSSGNGSTLINETIGSYQVTYDGEFALPTFTRLGYTFLGYKTEKLTSDQSKTNTRNYIGVGEEGKTYKTLSYEFANPESEYKLDINDEAKVITLYLVFRAEVFRAYFAINTNNLAGLSEPDFKLDITNADKFSENGGLYFVDVEFDHLITPQLEVELTGYKFLGWFSSNTYSPSQSELGGVVTKDTALDYDLFKTLSYDNNGTLETLAEKYGKGERDFTLFAHYAYKEIKLTLNKNDIYGYIESLDDYNAYVLTNGAKLDKSITGTSHYMSDVVFDFYPRAGRFIKTINISYKSVSGQDKTANFELVFNGEKFILTYNGTELNDSYLELLARESNVFGSVKIRVLPYNHNGDNAADKSVDTNRVLIAIENIKSDIKISVSDSVQKFNVSFMTNAKGENGLADQKVTYSQMQVNYGYELLGEDFIYPYLAGYKFTDYRYATLKGEEITTGTIAAAGDRVKSNRVIAANYEVAPVQAVNFYVFNENTMSYERLKISDKYVLYRYDSETNTWVSSDGQGTLFDINSFNNGLVNVGGGKLIKMPSSGSEIWPKGTKLVSYVIANQTDLVEGKYFSFLEGENSVNAKTLNLKVFDPSVRVEGEINVYAVYNVPLFEVKAEADKTQHTTTVSSDFALYHEYNGTMVELTYRDIFYLELSASEYKKFTDAFSGNNTLETALRTAINGDLSRRQGSVSENAGVQFTYSEETKYYFAITIVLAPDGSEQIYEVSSNCVKVQGESVENIKLSK